MSSKAAIKQRFSIGVFGSSANATNEHFQNESYRLGSMIAKSGHTCVNGAGLFGVMGALNRGVRDNGGHIRGIIHGQFKVDTSEDRLIKDIVVVYGKDLTERKNRLFDESDCFIIMPGGVGTFDELWEGVSSRSLNMKNLSHKPFCVVNLDGFYDGFLQQMYRAKKDGVLYMDVNQYFHVVDDVGEALQWCLEALTSESAASEAISVIGEAVKSAENGGTTADQVDSTSRMSIRSEDDKLKLAAASNDSSSPSVDQSWQSHQIALLATIFMTIGFALGRSIAISRA